MRGSIMKKIKGFLLILLMAIFMGGCTNSSEDDISKIKDEQEAILRVFSEYDSENETGIVHINERQDEKDRTYIYYVFQPPSLENYKSVLISEKNSSNRNQNQLENEMIAKLEDEASAEIIPKVKKLYTNQHINKIRIEVGVVWPYGEHSYERPGESVVGEHILYIKTFNFTRKNYNQVLNQISEELESKQTQL